MRRRDMLSLCATLAWPLLARPRDVMDDIRSRLNAAPVQRGQFEQRKTVKGFRQPLLSRGDFLVLRGKGVIWRTREPMVSSLVLTRDRLVNRGADGLVQQQYDAAREPAVRGMTELMFAILSADLSVLSQRFVVTPQFKTSDTWHLNLLPRDSALAQWAQRVEVEGDRQVRQVLWQDGMGDQSLIRLNAYQAGPQPSKDEEAWLA